jgi:hypothetical protein
VAQPRTTASSTPGKRLSGSARRQCVAGRRAGRHLPPRADHEGLGAAARDHGAGRGLDAARDNAISGTATGVDEVIARVELIAGYGVAIETYLSDLDGMNAFFARD